MYESLQEKAREVQAKLLENIDNENEISRKRDLLIQHSNKEEFVFDPNAPKNKAFKELIHITYVSPTPIDEKPIWLAKIGR
jgi:hypothetical protein